MFLTTTLKWRGYPLDAARERLRAVQNMPPDTFKSWQIAQRDAQLQHHFTHNPVYRNLLQDRMPDTWEAVPVLQKSHLQAPIETLLTAPYQRKAVYIGNTSGSSGHPFFYAKDKFCHAMTYALIEDRYRWHGLSLAHRQARFYGIPLSGKARQVELLKDRLANRRRFPVFDLSDQALDAFIAHFRTSRFHYVYGYTSALVFFARYLQEKGLFLNKICPTLKACIVTSEVCTPEDAAILQVGFGLPLLNEYGASELDIIAFTAPDGAWQLSEENLFIEVLDDAYQPVTDGREGQLVITSLYNRAFPMIRYAIGDRGRMERNGRAVLLELTGRTNDLVWLPSGKTAAGLTFYYISRSLLESGGFLREFIIRQTALDTFVFEIVGTRALTQSDIAGIQQAMDQYLEPGLRLEVREVARLERPVSGKIKHFYSEL